MFEVTSVVSDKKCVSSNVVHLSGVEEVKIQLDEWYFIVRFKSDEKGPRFEGEMDGDVQVLSILNHDNPFGEAIFNPISVATYEDSKNIWFTYFTSLIDPVNKVRRFEYCIWVEA